jgi:hypothetical protein
MRKKDAYFLPIPLLLQTAVVGVDLRRTLPRRAAIIHTDQEILGYLLRGGEFLLQIGPWSARSIAR